MDMRVAAADEDEVRLDRESGLHRAALCPRADAAPMRRAVRPVIRRVILRFGSDEIGDAGRLERVGRVGRVGRAAPVTNRFRLGGCT